MIFKNNVTCLQKHNLSQYKHGYIGTSNFFQGQK
jgi:hypothetical protein